MSKYVIEYKQGETKMEFVQFWTEMSWIVILLLCLSIGFAIAEGLIPGFGVCGILSIICTVGSLVAEGIITQSLFCVLFLLVLILIIAVILLVIFIYSAKRGLLKKTAIVESKSSLPENYGKESKKKLLVGRVGEVVSECKPVGKAEFEGETYTIISREKNIPKGSLVFVQEIKDNVVYVKELQEGGEDE